MKEYSVNSKNPGPFDNRLWCEVLCKKPTDKKILPVKCNCFIDTGACHTIVTERVIKALKLNCVDDTNQTYAIEIEVPGMGISFGKIIECRNWDFLLSSRLIASPMPGLDILIGLNVISQKRLIIHPCDGAGNGFFEIQNP
jgi:hypothetical protein